MSRMFAMPYLWLWNLRINMQVNSISARVDIWNLPIQPVQDRALNKAFGVPVGEAFGFMAGSPAAIGLVMADTAMKSAPLSIAKYMTPNKGTSHSNEVILAVSGDASAAKTAVLNARQTGLELLIGMGSYPEIPGIPYL